MATIRYGDILHRLEWSVQQQQRYRESRLRPLLAHAANKVPFYKKTFHRHGISERDVRHLRDLSLLPLTSRADLEGDPKAFLSEGVQRRACICRTNARTAEKAVELYLSSEENELLCAIERRLVESNGLKGRYSCLAAVPPADIPDKQSWRDRLFHGRRDGISDAETVAEQLRVLRERKPECFSAPLWILTRLVREIRKGSELGFRPTLLLTCGEPLRQVDCEALREAFGIVPTDVYRTWEFGPLAAECSQHAGLHVNFDMVYIEILRNGRLVEPGETGEVVVTGLANRTMPLIRYRLGDLARMKKDPCACGWPGPVLEGVYGRIEHAIALPGGDFVTARQLEECLDQFSNVREYRVVQSDRRMIEVLVVPATLFQDKTAQLVRNKCLELCRNQIGVELKIVGDLPLLSSRRRQSIISKVPH